MRGLIASVATALLLFSSPPSSAATTWGTDFSDWWWNPSEDGWALNIAHQGDVLFVGTFFYGPDRQPRWYSAALFAVSGSSPIRFTGDLIESTGPYFGGVYNPSTVTRRRVGAMTMQFPFISTGAVLNYSVDGVAVSKVLERMTWRNNNLAGSFVGGIRGTASGCAVNGAFEGTGLFTVTHLSNQNVSIVFTSDTGSCSFSGDYSQMGRMGRILGTVACTNGAQGTFDAVEIEAGRTGFFARYAANYGSGCTETGRIAAMER